MADPIQLSIALITRNRPDSLARALASIRAQRLQPYEVLVSDNSDPDYAGAIADLAQRWDCRYLLAPVKGMYPNRNFAATQCTGTHIHTMDDDHVWPTGHLEKCLAALERDRHSIWTTGERGFIEGEFFAHVERANQLSPSGVGIGITHPDDNWGIADGSTIYPRTVFDRGFRLIESFGGYGATYLEFGAYLYRQGFKSRSIPGAYVEHYADRSILTRRPLSMYRSRLYASIAYNRYFRPHRGRLLRYTLSYSWHLRQAHNPLTYLPQVWAEVEQRWGEGGTGGIGHSG